MDMEKLHTILLSGTPIRLSPPVQRLLTRLPLLLLTLAILFILIDYTRVLWLRRSLPPGPFPLPLLGNHFMIPKKSPWKDFEKWSQYYDNPMLTIWLGRKPVIILNDCWTASDLMEKKAALYSSRPRMIAMGDLINATETNQTTLVYGERWRLHRKLTHSVVGSQAVRAYRTFQGQEACILTQDLITNPSSYASAIERYSVSVASIIGWGRRISQQNDYVAKQALAVMEAVDFIIPGQFLLESLPWLCSLPAWLYRLPHQIRKGGLNFQKYFYALSEEGSHAPEENFSKILMREQEEHGLVDAEVASLTSNLIGGGVDTTSSSMISSILAMCLFPDVQRKAQEELDRVVGHDRSPTWNDEPDLPYLQALVKEVLRWRTVTILAGIPHAPLTDDVYRGYTIPAGTQITANLWAIHRHPREFPDPDIVKPERYLNGLHFDYPNSRGHNAFGYGRRQCSGQPLAEQSLFFTFARLLWAFRMEPGLDENGQEVKLDAFAYNDSENIRPLPFKAKFTPRSEKIKRILREEAEDASQALRVYDGETKLTVEGVVAAAEKMR